MYSQASFPKPMEIVHPYPADCNGAHSRLSLPRLASWLTELWSKHAGSIRVSSQMEVPQHYIFLCVRVREGEDDPLPH